METNLRPVELLFALKLQDLIDNNADLTTFTKIGFYTGTSASNAKNLSYKLRDKGIIKLESILGKKGSTKITLISDPMALLKA